MRISQSGGCGSISDSSLSSPTRRALLRRRSISSTSSIDRGASKSASPRALRSTIRAMSGKRDLARKEARDRDLVGGVEHDRRGAARFKRLRAPAAAQGSASSPAASKSSLPMAARSSRCAGRRHPLGPGERVSDRHPHVRAAQLGEHRAVDKFDQRMDRPTADGSRCRSAPTAGRTDNAPRSARAPCSSGSPNRPRSWRPSTNWDARPPAPGWRQRSPRPTRFGTVRRWRSG